MTPMRGLLPCIALLVLSDSALAQQVMPSALNETYNGWQVTCVTPAPAAGAAADAPAPVRMCEMVQELTRNDSGQRVLAMSLRVEGDGAAATIIAPLGLELAAGLSLTVDDAALVAVPFSTCVPAGCVAKASLTADQLSRLAAADKIGAEMAGNDGQPLHLDLTAGDLMTAWARLRAVDAESTAP
jgi:invasion protein IalB